MAASVGYALREENRPVLTDELIDAIEITFERADDPLRLERYLGDLDKPYVSIHALKLSPGSVEPPSKDYLEAIAAVAEENHANSVSDHLGFTRDRQSGAEMGHFAPVPLTPEALDVVCRHIDLIQDFFAPRHFFIENIAYLFRLQGSMTEAEFLGEVLRRTGCGWLCDVTNVYANAVNFEFDAAQFIQEVMPRASRVQMHLAGGFFDDSVNMYIDSHSDPIPEAVWELYRQALSLGGPRVDAVFIERDQNFPDRQGWIDEIRRARELVHAMDAHLAAD